MQNHAHIPVTGARWRLAAILLLAFAALPAWGQGGASIPTAKVAVIDVQRILTDSAAGKSALERLGELKKSREGQLKAKAEEIDGLRKQIDEGRLTLSEQRLVDLQKELEDKAIDLQRAQDDANRELEKSRESTFAAIEERVLPIIDEVGREMRLTLIFNKYQSGLLFAQDEADITDLILQRFDQSQAEGG